MGLLARFWQWWIGELSALLPRWIAVAFFGSVNSRPLVFRHDINALKTKRGTIEAPLWVFDNSPPVLPAGKHKVVADVMLPQDRCMKRHIEVPAKAASKLHSMAELDLKRNTPFGDGELLSVLENIRKSGSQIVADQWVAKRAELEHVKRQLKTAGVTMARVRIEGVQGILRDYSTSSSSGARSWISLNALLLAGTITATGYLTLYPAWVAQNEVTASEASLVKLRRDTVALRQEVDAMRDDRARLDELQTSLMSGARLVEVIRELTVSLPDESWLANLTFGPKAVTVGGETSGAAVDLILALSKSNFFSNPRQSGPTTRTGSGGERFEIAISLGAAQ